jgi:hypothetical protein
MRCTSLTIPYAQIVALQNNVLAINKSHLKRPTRRSLGADRGGTAGIVNSPY